MKKVCLAVLPALTIALELLPLGAVCIFATSPTERVKETFSYFSLTPFGGSVKNYPFYCSKILLKP